MFKIGEKAIGRRRETRSIEATAEPTKCVLKLSVNGADVIDILLVTMEKATHHLRRFVVSCSPRLGRGEHTELFEKLER